MSDNDWKSALAGLAASLPAEESPAEEEPTFDEPEEKAALLISMERKGRGGKTATIISGFTIDDDRVAALASQLKSRLATGGSSRGGEILIQGDRRTDVAALLKKLGYKTKGQLK